MRKREERGRVEVAQPKLVILLQVLEKTIVKRMEGRVFADRLRAGAMAWPWILRRGP